jgi:hypothetical protein
VIAPFLGSAKNGAQFHPAKFHFICKFIYFIAIQISHRITYQVISVFICNAILGQPCSLGCSVYNQIHDSIKAATKSKVTSNSMPNARKCVILRAACQNTPAPNLLHKIDKNAIIANYGKNCQKLAIWVKLLQLKR